MVVTLVNNELEKSVAVLMAWLGACLVLWTVRIRASQSSAVRMSGLQEKF